MSVLSESTEPARSVPESELANGRTEAKKG